LIASLRLRTRLHLFLAPGIWSDDAVTHALVTGAALLFAYLAKALSDLDPLTVDFSIFYVTARAWLEGQPMYGQIFSSVQLVNYNPPHFHLLVLPFAILPRSVSFVSWTVVSAALACATVRIAVRESAQQWPRRNVRLLVASTFLAAGVGATVRLGQLSWWLALAVTIAWRAARQKRSVVAGFWLGLAIGVKPFLLLLLPIVAIRREMVMAIVATVTALASLAAGVLVFGWPSVRDWAHLLETPPPLEQLRYFINASLAGLISRAQLPLVLSAILAVAVVLGTVVAARHGDVDRAWLLGITGALLASPVGWIYYFPLLAGPLIVMAAQKRLPGWTWYLWPLLAFPPFARDVFQSFRPVGATLGSIYAWGLIGLWVSASTGVSPPYGKRAGSGAADAERTGRSARTAMNDAPVSTSTL